MDRYVCKEWPRSDAIEGSPESPWNQSHRDAFRLRSRSPERRWRGMTSGDLDFAADRWVRGAVPIPQRDYHFTLQGRDFGEGILNGGASWPYSHVYSASNGVHVDEIRECFGARGRLDSSNGRRGKQGETKKIPCKFYAQGHCRHGSNCRYLHDSALETKMKLRVPIGISVNTNGHSWHPHHNASNNQMEPTTPVAVHTSTHVLSGYDMGNLKSEGIFGTDTSAHGLQLNSAQRSQNIVLPSEDFGSQLPLLFIPSRTSENGINNDKGQSSHVLGVQNGMHAANVATGNNQMRQNNFLVHPKRLGEFFVPQAGVNVPALSMQGQSSSQTLQEASVAPYSSADRVAASIYHDAVASEKNHIIDPYPLPLDGKALFTAAPVGKQFSQRNRDPRLLTNSSAVRPVPPSVPPIQQEATAISIPSGAPPSVPPIQQEATAISVPSAASPSVPPIQQETINMDDNNHPIDLSHSVEVTGQAAVPRRFKIALTKFVKKQLTKTWDSGDLTKELYKVIVQKVVEKVVISRKNIPDTSQMNREYLRRFKGKINKLLKEYLEMHDVRFLQ
ncbi:unnamed protein product [Urochloa decumbens]|uniref:C3H1-type domain-containing protein n=1 Tax=Urochloa decumbens TaxID=240449 RepID=A0ABC9GHY2_9POAL